jgi:hypothetical protein
MSSLDLEMEFLVNMLGTRLFVGAKIELIKRTQQFRRKSKILPMH